MKSVYDCVRFYVGDDEYTSEQLFIVIPGRYKPLFDGAQFKDMHHLSQAVGFARIAQEARNYDNAFKVAVYERCLEACFKKEVIR